MRIRGAKTEMEELGLDTEGMIDSTAKLREEIMALTGVDIMINDNQFKSTYAIMDELAAKWQDLTDIQQATVTELIAGKRQGNIVSSLMSNFDIARDALETSLESSGSAMREHEKWQQSLEARINKLKSTWQSLSQTFMKSDFLKVGLDVITGFVDVLDRLIDKLGTVPTLIGAFATFKGIGSILNASKDINGLKSIADILEVLSKAFPNAAKGLSIFKDSLNVARQAAAMTNGLAGGTSAVTALSKAAMIGKGALKGLWAVIAAHPIIAVVAAVGAGIAIFNKFHESAKELRERIEELTDSYDEQHEELQKLKGSYDTSNEDSMISKYGRLSKGVNALGENVSLTADEYSEYQGIVNTIADQIPSLVTGFNSQGDAMLSCAGDVDKLTEAYQNLIKQQNKEVIDNGEDIIKNFGNNVDKSSAYYIDDNGNVVSYLDELKTLVNMSDEELEAALRGNARLGNLSAILDEYGIERDVLGSGEKGYEGFYDHVIRAVTEDREKFKEILDTATSDVNAYAEEMDSLVESYFSTAFLGGGSGTGIGDYSHLSDRMQGIIKQVISSFDTSFYNGIFDGLESPEEKYAALTEYFNSILDSFDNLNNENAAKIEAAFDLKTQFNGGEISYGEYVDGLYDVGQTIDKLVKDGKLDKEIGTQIKLNIGLNEHGAVEEYQNLVNRLTDTEGIGMKHVDATDLINSLNASELSVLVDLAVSEEVDLSNFDAESLREYIEEQAKIRDALNFKADFEVDITALEVLNTALEESASAMGLTTESIDSLKSKYSELDSYDAATLFEKTANGVKVNREELAKLEKKQNDLAKSEVQEHIDSLTEAYNENAVAIDKCRNAGERAQLIAKGETYKDKIEELATYQAQLEGVTGAYQRWLNAQETPEDYEGYENVATSREDIEDEIDRGFISNATKEYIDLLSGEDLVGGTIDDYAEAWEKLDQKVGNTSYSIHDFFTVNDDGDITSTGIDRFFKGLQQDFKGSVANFNEETGQWEYDFSQENLQKIQDEWGIGIEAIELLLEAAASAGYDVDWDGVLDGIDLDTSNFETLLSYAEQAQKEFNELEGIDDVHFNFTATGVEEATTEVEKARKTYLDLITNKDGTINLKAEGAEQMRVMLSTLLIQKQQLEDSNIAINIDTSGLDESQQDVANAIEAVKTFREKYKNLEIAVTTGQGIDTAKSELSKAMGELQTLGGEGVDIAAQLILGEGTDGETLKTKVDAAITAVGDKNIKVGCSLDETAIGTLNSQILTNFTPEATVKITGIDDALVNQYTSTEKTAEGTVKWKNDESLVVEYQEKTKKAVGIVDWANNTENVKKSFSANGTVKWTSGNKVKVDVISEANGTANANGTTSSLSGRTFARGDWGIKGSGTALVGELGMETLVRGGRFYTIGDNGAEFIKYRQGDIIFNHKQTEELFKNGKVTSDGGRGRMFANGSAFVDGAAFWQASASSSNFVKNRLEKVTIDGSKAKDKTKAKTKTKTKVKDNSVTTNVTTNFGAKATSSNWAENKIVDNGDSGKENKDFEETFDFVEIAIKRIERAIDSLDKKANNVYTSWSSRNQALTDEISKIGDEITLQTNAKEAYMAEANSVGLSEDWAEKVRLGIIGIYDENDFDEATYDKIQQYKDWYEKAIACEDAIQDLKITEAELYEQRFENVQAKYDGILQGFEHTESMLNEYISQAEAQGHIVSKEYYQALIKNEKNNISQLKKEQAALIAARDQAVNSGKIIKGSQAWYDMCADIDAVTEAIEEGETALIEYANSMRDIDWEVFDLIQERISDITAEADFLIDLMSNKKLYDDKGQLTDQGMATMALHGQNYNTYMYQADDYGAKVQEIDNKIASGEYDPYDGNVIAKRREYLELQRESILAAEGEKDAIRDMVEEGINLELDALQELIDKKNEELESERDLYEYQKKVKEQTEEIASLEKQMAAYSGDDSEEAKAKVQQLKIDLETAKEDLQETEYDKLISDSAALLDNLYLEYETLLNTRLDNVDVLLEQMIAEINLAAGAEGTIATALGAEGALATAMKDNTTTIGQTLKTEVGAVGATLSTAMSNIWLGDGSGKEIIDSYGKDFQTKSTTTNNTLNSIKTNVAAMVDDVDKDAQKKVEAPKTKPAAKKSPISGDKQKVNLSDDGNKYGGTKITDDVIKGVAAAIWIYGKNSGWGNNPFRENKLTDKLGASNAKKVQDYVNKHGANGDLYKFWIQNKKNLDKYKYGAFKLGARNIDYDQLAWTQEGEKQEFIVRPSDGAILTPIAKGDSVLNAAATNNIWNMANSPAEFIKDNLNLGSANVPNNQNVQSNYTQHFDKVVFNLPNVKNYDELLSAMQKDKNFERLISAMTIDRLAGKSSLAKGKAIR